MNKDELVARLLEGKSAITALVSSVPSEEAEWRPAPDRWTLLEIVNHLADEERLDFRTRLRLIANDPAADWPPFNAIAGVDDGEYMKRRYPGSVARWAAERSESLEWLQNSPEVDPRLLYAGRGSDRILLRAGDLMSSWVAHDFFHLRQIIRLRWDYLASDATPDSPLYAGTEE